MGRRSSTSFQRWPIGIGTAEALSSIGPAVAYVGVSMGMVLGASTVVALPSIKAEVFGMGGIPTGGGINDPPLREMLLGAASRLETPQVLMLNMSQDEVFSVEGTHAFFDAIPGRKKRLGGDHDDGPAEAIRHSVAFLKENTE